MNNTTLSQALSQLSGLDVTVSIRKGGTLDAYPELRRFTLAHPPTGRISCPRPDCEHGGWFMDQDLRAMILAGETEGKAFGICSGQQRMNKTETRSCLTHFNAEIALTYKDAD